MRWATSWFLVGGLLLGGGAGAAPAGSSGKSVSALVAYGAKPSSQLVSVEKVTVTPATIVEANVRAATTLYVSAVLEEMKLFAVADRIAEQFANGKIPIARSPATAPIEQWYDRRGERLGASERARMYGHVLGSSAGGSSTALAQPNQEFAPLWARFIDAVGDYERKTALAPSAKGASVSREQVRKAGRDLALNLSNRSYGAALYVAARLAKQMKDAEKVLSSEALLGHFGVANAWELVDVVAKKELGGAPDTVRLRSQAESAARLLDWLARAKKALESGGPALPALPAGDAKQWSQVAASKWKSSPATGSAIAKVAVLCLDAKKKLVPCKAVVEK
jgi:hypothetical protein